MSWPRAIAPDIHLITVQAAVDERCIWVVTPNVPLHSHVLTPDGWATLIDSPDAPETTTFHAYAVALHRGVFPDYEHGHRITAEVAPDGSLTYTYRLPGLAPDEVAAFMAIWERTWKRIGPGRRRGATTYPRSLIHDKLADSERLQRQGFSRPKRAARLGLPEGTLREWEENREKDPRWPN